MKEKWFIRCEECAYMKKKNGEYTCEECFGQKCSEIDDCPCGCTAEGFEETEKKAKENKIQHGASAEKKKERKPREVKQDAEKQMLIKLFADALENIADEVKITNIQKEIEFRIGENHYNLDVKKHRPPKKK